MLPNKNTHFKVKNLHGTTGLACQCSSWMAHWRNYTNSERTTCAVVGCYNIARVGAHVVSVDQRTDRQWWIVPFCDACNNWRNNTEFYIDSRTVFVSANKNYTCKSDY